MLERSRGCGRFRSDALFAAGAMRKAYHVFLGLWVSRATASSRSCRYMALAIREFDPIPIRTMNFPASRSLRHSDVMLDERMILAMMLQARKPTKTTCASTVFQTPWYEAETQCFRVLRNLLIHETQVIKIKLINVRRSRRRRFRGIKGMSLPENWEIWVCCPTRPKICMAFLVGLLAPSFLT